jgi:release factor glutamine methyltransferase
MKFPDEMPELTKKQIKILNKVLHGYPVQYALGKVDFSNLEFHVNKHTLIPRPETEELVDLVIKENSKGEVLDLCTGSGAIGVSLALSEKFNVTASDISLEALEVAKTNAEKLKANVTFIHSNLFENIDKKFDIIVSNPPYLTKQDMQNLQKEVKFEPKLALYGGEDGLDFYRQIISNAYKYLNEKGVLYLEIGINQYKDIENIVVKEQKYSKVQVIKDIQGVERIVKVNL